MILRPTPISTQPMWFDHETRRLGVEASSLPKNLMMGRIYDDAADIGLTVVSHKTGKERIVSYVGEARDNEGELMFHIFRPIDPVAEFSELRIYND